MSKYCKSFGTKDVKGKDGSPFRIHLIDNETLTREHAKALALLSLIEHRERTKMLEVPIKEDEIETEANKIENQINNENYEYLLTYKDEDPVGEYELNDMGMIPEGRQEVEGFVFVHPEHRRNELALRLYETLSENLDKFPHSVITDNPDLAESLEKKLKYDRVAGASAGHIHLTKVYNVIFNNTPTFVAHDFSVSVVMRKT